MGGGSTTHSFCGGRKIAMEMTSTTTVHFLAA